MSNNLERNTKLLYSSNFEVERGKNGWEYFLKDWYHTQYAVPLAIVGAGLDPFSYNDNTLKIGGNEYSGDMSSLLWMKNYFKFNPNNYYRITVRAKSDAVITFGFIGYTSKPITDLYTSTLNVDDYRKELLNICRFMYTPDKTSIKSTNMSTNEGPRTINHFKTNRDIVTNNTYTEMVGYLKGYAPEDFQYTKVFNNIPVDGIPLLFDGSFQFNSTTNFYNGFTFTATPGYKDETGTVIFKPLPVWDKVIYITPFMLVNYTTEVNKNRVTYIDFIKVEEMSNGYIEYTDNAVAP